MLIFRLTKEKYSHNLSGIGASLSNNRWNTRGFEVIYCSENRALAMAEVLIHLPLNLIPEDFVMLEINIPETIKIQNLAVNELSDGWNKMPYDRETQLLGNQFISEGKAAILKVPSAVVKGNFNYLLNPNHADFNSIKIEIAEPFPLDDRFFH